jgi:hypothetical protein
MIFQVTFSGKTGKFNGAVVRYGYGAEKSVGKQQQTPG